MVQKNTGPFWVAPCLIAAEPEAGFEPDWLPLLSSGLLKQRGDCSVKVDIMVDDSYVDVKAGE